MCAFRWASGDLHTATVLEAEDNLPPALIGAIRQMADASQPPLPRPLIEHRSHRGIRIIAAIVITLIGASWAVYRGYQAAAYQARLDPEKTGDREIREGPREADDVTASE